MRALAAAGRVRQRFVLTSSASVLYEGRDLENATEDQPYAGHPADPYTETKIMQEQVRVRLVCSRSLADRSRHGAPEGGRGQVAAQIVLGANSAALQTIALRPHMIFGPNDQCVATMVQQGRKGSMRFMVGQGHNVVDATFVKNLVHAHLLAAESLTPGSVTAGKAYHITNDEPVKFWGFTGDVLELYGMARPSIALPASLLLALTVLLSAVLALLAPLTGPIRSTFTPSRIRLASTHHSYSCERAKRELGYRPLYTNREALLYTREHSTAR